MQNRVEEYRKQKGYTQEKLAEIANVSRNTISYIENDANANVTYGIMQRIANALGKKVATIFFEN